MNVSDFFDLIEKQLDFNLSYAEMLVVDLSPQEMTHTPSKGLVNHPAFTLGHLVTGSAIVRKYLEGDFELPDGWDAIFLRKGPGDPRLPTLELDKYPSKEVLLKELSHQHMVVKEKLRSKSLEELQEPFDWRYSSTLPTLMDVIVFLCITHEAMHLGQLAAWRRALDKDSALAKL